MNRRLLQHFTWELPQTILGLLVVATLKLFNKVEHETTYRDGRLQVWTSLSIGVSLGRYVIVPDYPNPLTVAHEYGHCIQSIYLGPLYLIVVGVPSITMNLLTRARLLSAENYYKRWPESWADRLAGVQRNR